MIRRPWRHKPFPDILSGNCRVIHRTLRTSNIPAKAQYTELPAQFDGDVMNSEASANQKQFNDFHAPGAPPLLSVPDRQILQVL